MQGVPENLQQFPVSLFFLKPGLIGVLLNHSIGS